MTNTSATEQSQGRRYWQAHVTAQQRSGLSRAEYCRRHNLSYHALTYWRNKLSKTSGQHAQLVRVPAENILPGRTGSSSGIRVVLDSRIAIELTEHFSSEALGRVLSVVLESR